MLAASTVTTPRIQATDSFWPHDLVLGILPLILTLQAFLWAAYLPAGLNGISDLRQLYTGGYIVRTGHPKQLYNYDLQWQLEKNLVGGQLMLPVNHLAFEELFFAPLSLFPYRTAYWVFLVFNTVLLIVCARLLRPRMKALSDRWRWFPVLLIPAFYPISRALVLGQDSIIMLTLLVGALYAVDHDNELTAGLIVGVGMFKFQIVIPIALLFLIWRRWRVCTGFVISGGTAGMISLGLVGLGGAKEYMSLLSGMSLHLHSTADMIRYGTFPTAMMNLRGLATALLGGTLSAGGLQFAVLVASAAVLVMAAKQRPSLPMAIMAGSLVSYHFLCHDASILIIPLATALGSRSAWSGAAAVLLLLAPIASVIPSYGYLAAIPLIALFVLSSFRQVRTKELQPCLN
jgi:hypothetical protein